MSARVLVVTDRLDHDPALAAAVRARSERGPATFRLIATNPARAEFHVAHAERHDALERAQPSLQLLLQRLEAEAEAPLTGAVSIRHDAFEAVEEDLLQHPSDEVIVAVHEHAIARRLHHDLEHRLTRLVGSVSSVARHDEAAPAR